MRIPHLWFASAAALGLAAFTVAVLAIANRESLWIDELHTSWCANASAWRQIAQRAADGNQTPAYFWFIACLQQTLGGQVDSRAEWIVRLPSMIAWFVSAAIVAAAVVAARPERSSDRAIGPVFIVGIVAWIAFDRLHWFYATEARPYALLQLTTFAGWCSIAALSRNQSWPRVAWLVLAIASVHLHLTAALPVACQWLVGCAMIWRRSRNSTADAPEQAVAPEKRMRFELTVWAGGAVVVAIACLPILSVAFPVWQRRTQWAAFASDISITNAIKMFPVVPIVASVVVALVIDRIVSGRRAKSSDTSGATETRFVWWSAMLAPWLIAWAVTALEIAPVFHRRFVIACALPLVMLGAVELMRVRAAWLRGLALIVVSVSILYSQGSIDVWRKGYLVGQLRGEDWRGAIAWLNEQAERDDGLLCSSGLVEANGVNLPLDAELADYLEFPVHGLYEVRARDGESLTTTPLVADAALWHQQILALPQSDKQRFWIVYRGAAGRLREKLNLLNASLPPISSTSANIHSFGRVHVAEIHLHATTR